MVLIVQPTGGLCNRMRVLDSAISFAYEKQQNVNLIWLRNAELNCRLEELFVFSSNAFQKVIQMNSSHPVDTLKRKLLKTPFQATGNYLQDSKDIISCLDSGETFESIFLNHFRNKKSLYLCTCYRFYSIQKAFSNLKPTRDIQKTINSYTQHFKSVIGIHIRRGDHKGATAKSPTSRFIELMKDEIEADKDVHFFLATDSPMVEEELKELFRKRIIIHPKSSLDRNNPLAIKDAMVDLYVLSQTRKLIGSHASSFTETASLLGNISLTIA